MGEFLELFGFFARMTWLPAICFIFGFGLVIVEMFYPGFGAPGISGVILLFLGVILLADTLLEAFIMTVIILAILGLALALVVHSATKGRLSRVMVLNDSLKKELGFSSSEDLNCYLNKEGTAITVLRPSGTADFDGVKIDVVSQGEYIEKGTKIKVLKVEGSRIVVSEIT